MDQPPDFSQLTPLAYQRAIVGYLKTEDPGVWQWFAAKKDSAEQTAAARLDLLKSTYRIERATQGELYTLADQVARELNLQLPLTLYQAQHSLGLNASIVYLPGEAHIVLSGPLATTLSPLEWKALFGHELAHRLLWDQWRGEYQIAAQMLEALANDPAAADVYSASARLYALYCELFCDRAAWLVTRDLAATVSTLVKISTGLVEVSAESYLRQAEEIFSHEDAKTEGLTHPESYIRARALRLWVEHGEGATSAIAAMLEGPLSLRDLDLLGQKRIALLTRRLIDQLLAPAWFQTEAVLAHARGFFEAYTPPMSASAEANTSAKATPESAVPLSEPLSMVDEELPADLATRDTALQDYYSYLLLDFATIDRDLEELPLAAALVLAKRLGLTQRFNEIALKELKLTKKRFNQIVSRAEALLTEAHQAI